MVGGRRVVDVFARDQARRLNPGLTQGVQDRAVTGGAGHQRPVLEAEIVDRHGEPGPVDLGLAQGAGVSGREDRGASDKAGQNMPAVHRGSTFCMRRS